MFFLRQTLKLERNWRQLKALSPGEVEKYLSTIGFAGLIVQALDALTICPLVMPHETIVT